MRNHLHRLLDSSLSSWGVPLLARLEDRRILERTIFPYVALHREFHDILCVGCAWYTAHYPALFRAKNFLTLDIDPNRRRHGAAHMLPTEQPWRG